MKKEKIQYTKTTQLFVEWMLDPLCYVSLETRELRDECVNDEGKCGLVWDIRLNR